MFHYNPLRGRPLGESTSAFQTVLSYQPNHGASVLHLARIASKENRLDELEQLVEHSLKLSPEGDRLLEMICLQAFSSPRSREQEQTLARLERASDLTLALAVWDVAFFARNLEGVHSLLQLMLRPSRSMSVQSVGHLWMAAQALARGQPGGAPLQPLLPCLPSVPAISGGLFC